MDHPAKYWHTTESGRVQCDVCPRDCTLSEGQRAEVAEIARFLQRIWVLQGGDAASDPSSLAEGCDGIRDALTKLEVALCTGVLPVPLAQREKAPAPKPECLGRVRYLAPGQPEPDPREWQFRKVSKKGSRVYVRVGLFSS